MARLRVEQPHRLVGTLDGFAADIAPFLASDRDPSTFNQMERDWYAWGRAFSGSKKLWPVTDTVRELVASCMSNCAMLLPQFYALQLFMTREMVFYRDALASQLMPYDCFPLDIASDAFTAEVTFIGHMLPPSASAFHALGVSLNAACILYCRVDRDRCSRGWWRVVGLGNPAVACIHYNVCVLSGGKRKGCPLRSRPSAGPRGARAPASWRYVGLEGGCLQAGHVPGDDCPDTRISSGVRDDCCRALLRPSERFRCESIS